LGAKKEIFIALGSNLILKDRKLIVSLDNLLFPIQTAAKKARKISTRLEPTKNSENKAEIRQIYAKNPVMLRELDDVRTCLMVIN
jgi:hypothetical protein